MRVKINGDYRVDDFAVLGQHVAVQLEALGIVGVGNVWLSVRPLDAKGRKLDVLADGAPVDTIELAITDLERPAVQSATLSVRPSMNGGSQSAPSPSRKRTRKRPYNQGR